jgi:hypothetical protein
MLSLPAVRTDGFSLSLSTSGNVPVLKLSGNGDAAAVSPLDRSLSLLHHNLMVANSKSVIVDLCDLYFLNSSCLKAFVSWIYTVRTAQVPYGICLRLNARQRWQRRGLEPLQRLAPTIVSLDEVSADAHQAESVGEE